MANQSARRVFWNATKITDGNFALADELGTLAPESEIGRPETISVGPAFGFQPTVGATISLTLMVYGETPEAAIGTAAQASPPTYGYVHVIDADLAGYSWYHVHPTAPGYAVPRGTERQRPMVAYGFFGEGDSEVALAGNATGPATFV